MSLIKFIILTGSLYGQEFISFNVHQLSHLVKSVKLWGPLWCTSAFMFENNNGNLLKLLHGTNHVPNQICYSYGLQKLLLKKSCKTFSKHSSVSARNLFAKFLSSKISRGSYLSYSEGVTFCGRSVARKMTVSERVATRGILMQVHGYVRSYSRVLFNGQLYATNSYCTRYKRCNSIAVLTNGNVIEILSILVTKNCVCSRVRPIECGHGDTIIIVGRKLMAKTMPYFTDHQVNIRSTNIIFEVNNQINSVIIASRLCNLARKCVLIKVNSSMFVTMIPNLQETE